jgi:Alkylmercury lyase
LHLREVPERVVLETKTGQDCKMADEATLDRAFHAVMMRMVKTGQAPHYVELAAELGADPESGREILHDLITSGIPAWLHPGTDLIASFPPFNNQPTQYRISVDGEQRWFAQCGFEALAVRWLFPGKLVRVDAPCLDCGDSMSIEMRDDEILSVSPPTIVGYSRSAVGGDADTRPFR